MSRFFQLITFVIICNNVVYAQANKDCNDALVLCGEPPFQINVTEGVGVEDVDISGTCLFSEYNSTWITWTIMESGNLTFVLTPDETDGTDHDLDFLVFKVENGCDDMDILRCMATGETVGMETPDECIGPTGLAIGETDIEETAGCFIGDNNFLAPLEVLEGEQYMLLVNAFSFPQTSFELSFGGSAELDCISTDTDDMSAFNEEEVIISSMSNGDFTIELDGLFALSGSISIYDLNGQTVFSKMYKNQANHIFSLSNQKSGMYVVCVNSKHKHFIEKIFVLK